MRSTECLHQSFRARSGSNKIATYSASPGSDDSDRMTPAGAVADGDGGGNDGASFFSCAGAGGVSGRPLRRRVTVWAAMSFDERPRTIVRPNGCDDGRSTWATAGRCMGNGDPARRADWIPREDLPELAEEIAPGLTPERWSWWLPRQASPATIPAGAAWVDSIVTCATPTGFVGR